MTAHTENCGSSNNKVNCMSQITIPTDPRPAPQYLVDAIEFQDAWGDWHLLARYGEPKEFWLFFWNPNYQCWTSLRKPSNRDLDYIEMCDREGCTRLK